MTGQFVRSGPANSRALWHIVNPESENRRTFCSRSLSGPSTDDPAEVLVSPWSCCETCTERRWAAIQRALRMLRVVAPDVLIESERRMEET